MSIQTFLRWLPWFALAALPACNVLVGANFDVGLRPEDGGISLDAQANDAGTNDARSDAALPTDANVVDASNRDAVSLDAGVDVPDGGIDIDGGLRPTIFNGGFIYLGDPNVRPSPIELRGQIISSTIVRGTTPDGITIQGRFQ